MYCNENSGCENLLRGWIGKPNLKDHKNNNQDLRYGMGGKELTVTCK